MPDFLRRMPEAALRILVVLVIFAAGVLIVHRAIPPAYTDHDLQIAATIEREGAKQIHYAGETSCTNCHLETHDVKKAGYHRNLACETCHGPGIAHTENPIEVKPPAPRDRQFCPTCHAYNSSRPMSFPQINAITHNPLQACIACHQPHDPKPPTVPGECRACHGGIDRTKAVSHHALLECTRCHTTPEQHKVTPLVVKASKPSTREFCGECHANGSKIPEAPKVDIATHGEKYLCWQCHYPHMPEVD